MKRSLARFGARLLSMKARPVHDATCCGATLLIKGFHLVVLAVALPIIAPEGSVLFVRKNNGEKSD